MYAVIMKTLIIVGLMLKQYKFPMNLFLIFEKLEPTVYTSECLTANHYAILLPKEYYYIFHKVLKNELFFSASTLIEQSCIDTKYFDKLSDSFHTQFGGKRILLFNILYFYFIKVRLTLFVSLNLNSKISSVDSLYPNANWIERETSEMFGVIYTNKKDIRNLLLDYSRNEYPMLKEFPCEGYYDLYFDFFNDQLQYVESEFVEL